MTIKTLTNIFFILCMSIVANANNKITEVDASDTPLKFKILSESTVEVTRKGYSSIDSITIPSKVRIDGKVYTVTQIGDEAFYKYDRLKHIDIPSSVTHIGKKAFGNCGLTNIKFPDALKIIEKQAFEGSSLNTIEIPSSVIKIGEKAFSYCHYMTSINVKSNNSNYSSEDGILYDKNKKTLYCVPKGKKGDVAILSSVTNIANYACYECCNLTNMTIPNSVTNIGEKAFYGCSRITNINIPSSVTHIGANAFYGCSHLTNFNVDPNNLYFTEADGILYDKNKTKIICVPNGIKGDIKIASGVRNIKKYEFSNCFELNSVSLPSSVTKIGKNAFFNCTKLSNINIPSNVTSIGDYAFVLCENLTSIKIPSSVYHIGKEAFSGCKKLDVIIDNSKDYVSISEGPYNGSFIGCKSVTYTKNDVVIKGSETPLKFKITNGSEVGVIKDISYRDLDSIAIPVKVQIQNSVYTVTSIEKMAFEKCKRLRYINIAPSIKSIEYGAFFECKNLTSITIPSSVNKIKDDFENIFQGCDNLEKIDVWESNPNYSSEDGILYNKNKTIFIYVPKGIKGKITIPSSIISISLKKEINSFQSLFSSYTDGVFSRCKRLRSIVISEGVKEIGNYAFYGCDSLINVEIPSSICKIGDNAFYGCDELTNINIPSNVTSIGKKAFAECYNLKKVELYSNISKIGEMAFYECKELTNINISSSITDIGKFSFTSCQALKSINVDPNNPNYSSIDGVLYDKNKTKLICVPAGFDGKIVMPSSVTSIEDAASYNCSDLKSITLSSNITNIGENAFVNCVSLNNLNIPSNVISIGKNAFAGCTGLKKLKIGSGVKTIGRSAFHGCVNLTNVDIPSSVIDIEQDAFAGCTKLELFRVHPDNPVYTSTDGTLYKAKTELVRVSKKNKGIFTIPSNITRVAKNAFTGCDKLTSIEIPSSVTNIDDYVFTDCKRLTNINVASDNPNYSSESGILYDKNKTEIICVPAGINGNFSIPSSVKSIRKGAFASCIGLTNVTIPSSVTSIGESAFYNCTSLNTVNIPSGVTAIKDLSFAKCTNLTNINIHTGITEISFLAFNECINLRRIEIPSNVTIIANLAFKDCKKLDAVVIVPKDVDIDEVGKKNFITKNEYSVAADAFKGCKSVKYTK